MDSYFSLTNPNLVAAAIGFLALLYTLFFYRKSRSHQEKKTMATSSLTLLAPRNWKYHVFPSFHGADVRTNFLSHVLKELRNKGIDSFIDNDIERSKLIGPELVEAIRGSRIAIVLLSRNYASSTWCLNELVEIMKGREEFGQTVVPLFYEVDPTDVKKQTGDFGKVLGKTCRGKEKEDIQRWKRALTEVAQIAGFHSANGENEAELIEYIATDVSNKLNLSAPCSDFDGLVGMESRMAEMRQVLQLDSDEVRKIGILGPPGIGKTTIARSLFNRHSQDFQLSVFMDNIKRKFVIMACSDDYSVKLDFQKQFMSQLTNETGIKIPHLGVAKDRLKDKKVLVILDDVDQLVQLEAMAKETSWFGPGSRIIITTQDEKVLKASGIDHIHRVNLPSDDEALQMFCMYAFDQKYPKDGFKKLACEVRNLVGGLPLGLRVMGSYFRGMSEQDWREALPRLKIHLDRNGEISSILKFSYDALNDEDKRLFLHIACFFSGEPVEMVERCLEKCFQDVRQGLRVLSEKSLIYSKSGLIMMSTLLFQLGRQIVQKESISEPGKRQFLNDAIDIGEVLSDDKAGNSSVIGIDLEWNKDITWTSERAFERLSNLQFIRILGKGVNPLSMNYISRKLKVLIWPMFPMPCFPSRFNPEFLVNLFVRNSNLEKLWEENKPLKNIKWMDLALSRRLKELPDLSTAINLYYLDLSYCSSLVKLPSSIGNATNLEKLSLNYCSSLVKLPSSIGNAINLKTLSLKGCSSMVKLPSSIWNIVNLEELNLENCSNLVELPSLLRSEIEKCTKSDCSRGSGKIIDHLPFIAGLLPNPQFEKNNTITYYESSTNIEELDPWIGRILRLRRLVLSGMRKLVSLPQLPDSLLELDAENCESLERLHCSFPNQDIRLNFANCFQLNQEARDLIIQTPTNKYAVFPTEKVPICFSYRSSGSSLTVKLNRLPVGKSTKFKACILCSYDEENNFGLWETASVFCTITFGGNASIACNKRVERVLPGNLCTFEVEVETEEVTSTKLVFDFGLLNLDFKTWKIKGCGILQLLEGPFEDFEPSDIELVREDDGDERLPLL
ncbi:probable disease resistance protein RPP1 [Brassica napus]|uniref:probable disease resistance protein RPP1 n=1 Tax=Brassica napus TaxID=3708 RepID=UPI002078A795|nr:probable disease resistance protein RPP1 [Brassica napus]